MADIDIFGTLNNATPEGVLARADQIKDETQNKKQSEINAEVKEQIEQLSQGGGIEDAPSDGKTYGRQNGTWNEVEGITELSLDRPHDVIMSSMLDSITTPGVYKIKSPNYYCEGRLEVVNVSMTTYGRLLKQILRISEKDDDGGSGIAGAGVDIPYASRYRFSDSGSRWTDWVKISVKQEVDLGELAISSIDEPFPSEFFYIKDVGSYKFTTSEFCGSGTLDVSKVRINDSYGNRLITKQVVRMSITDNQNNFDSFNINIIDSVRLDLASPGSSPDWTAWKKTKTPLT